MWRVWADPRCSHWFLLITILFGNLNANDTFNCKTGWMRFDLLGGNYFHALSRADLSQKGGQQLLCKSFFFFALFLFTFLTREERNRIWMQQNDFGFCSLTNLERKKINFCFFCFLEKGFFSALLHSELCGYTHGPDSKPLSKTSRVDTSSHTLSYKTPRWYRWVLSTNTACFTFCTEKPSTLFLLINNNSEWFKLQSILNDSEIQHNTTLVTA